MTISFSQRLVLSVSVFLLAACGKAGNEDSSGRRMLTTNDGTIEAQIGPITSIALGEVDPDLIAEGEKLFRLRCTACHQLDDTSVGPPLGDILVTRTPVYVLNMILNPTGMLENHPDAKAMLEEFAVPMADLGISESEARAILEYLR